MRRIALAWAASALVTLGVFTGCSSSAGDAAGGSSASGSTTTGGAGGSPGEMCGGLLTFFADPDCRACAKSSCCTEVLACDDGTACGELSTCRNACTDGACVTQCEQATPDGKAPLAALDACLDGPCAADCGGSGVCDSGLSTGDATCDQCFGDSCCSAVKTCAGSANCSACLLGEPSATNCNAEPLLAPVETCLHNHCQTDCATVF